MENTSSIKNSISNNNSVFINDSVWQEAEELRKAGKFEQAFPIFMESFKSNADEGSLWRAVHCARKIGNYEEVISLIEENKGMLLSSQALKNQFCWLQYDYIVDKNKKAGNWEAVLEASENILEMIDDSNELLFKLSLFSAIDAARNLKDVQKVLELTDYVGPEKLSAECENYKGKKLLSYRERWFFARLNALFESQLYEECRELSLEAIKQYPRRIEFSRRAALCKMMLGKYGEAEEELQAISRMRGCPWYIVADLAKLRFNVGSFNRALEAAFEATVMHGELQTKVNLFTLIAKIQLVLGNSESAKNHIMLACSIRKDMKWKFNSEITQLASRFGIGDKVPMPKVAVKACEKEWREHTNISTSEKPDNIECSSEPIKTALQGFITSIVDERPFTFITRADNDQKVYAKISDIPEDLRISGAEVEFDLVESFDKLKNKKSVRATNVRVIKTERAVA